MYSWLTGLHITPGLSGFGLKLGGTLPVAGGHFSLALNGCTFLRGMTHTTSGFYIPSSSMTSNVIVKNSKGTGTPIHYLERARI
jgi:hypothetical protein